MSRRRLLRPGGLFAAVLAPRARGWFRWDQSLTRLRQAGVGRTGYAGETPSR